MPIIPPATDKLDVVLLGTFNPKIFNPDWFLRQGIVNEEEYNASELEVTAPDIAQCKFAGLALEVLQERFVLGTTDLSRSGLLQDTLLAILSLLPHTPIIGCGINVRHYYDLGDESYWHKIGHTLAPKDLIWNQLLEKPGLQNLTVKSVRDGEFPGEINLTVGPRSRPSAPYGIFTYANTHFGRDREVKPISVVKEFFTREWRDAIGRARALGELIFSRIARP
jgi:hypothetical protein